MDNKTKNFIGMVVRVLDTATKLKDKHTKEHIVRANYLCIFCHSETELQEFSTAASRLGSPVLTTSTGVVFHVTDQFQRNGVPKLLKIRKPDPERLERGDADFTVDDYAHFKKTYVDRIGFKLIPLENAEMIELIDPEFDVRVYFSNPPLDVDLGI